MLKLPAPDKKGNITLEATLQKRRSVRSFENKDLSLKQISQLLWAAQGITNSLGFRTAPSAGAIYPIEIYVVKSDGVFRYSPVKHTLAKTMNSDQRGSLSRAALGQRSISDAPITIIIAADFEKIESKYRDRAKQYTYQESGHIAQNILLQATALSLGGVPIGAFDEEAAQNAINLSEKLTVLYLISIGKS